MALREDAGSVQAGDGMFMKGEKCELHALEGSDYEVSTFASHVNAGFTTRHLFTGSIPMRQIDVKEVWERERKAGSVEFAIYLPIIGGENSRRFVGTCGLYSHRDIYRGWELRILVFTPDAIGHGIGTEATELTVNYAFERLNAHRVWLGVNAENIGAIKCYSKVGFKEEGRLREELYCFGHYVDAIRMGVLESEWTSASPAKA